MIQIFKEGETDRQTIFAREDPVDSAAAPVQAILADVKANGDAALKKYTKEFDGVDLTSIEVGMGAIDEGFRAADPGLVEILYRAADRIAAFHQRQVRNSFLINDEEGILMGQKILPLQRVGLYVPGGTAAYPSSVLMNCIPAKLAGVKEIVHGHPPGEERQDLPQHPGRRPHLRGGPGLPGGGRPGGGRPGLRHGERAEGGQDRRPRQPVRGRGEKAGLRPGGHRHDGRAQRDSGHRRRQVQPRRSWPRTCSARPSTTTMASAVLVTDSQELAQAVQAEHRASRSPSCCAQDIARASIDNNGKIILAQSLDTAVEIANEIAPEHLEVCVDQPFDVLSKITNAGSVFLGRNCPEALGDYFAGPNHTLPTSGTARFSSPLSVDDFVKKMQYTYYTKDALAKAQMSVSNFAKKEGLTGHARSIDIRFDPAVVGEEP